MSVVEDRARELLDKWVKKENISWQYVPRIKPLKIEYLRKWEFSDLESFSSFCAFQEVLAVKKAREETAQKIFDWLDTRLFKDNELWRGNVQEVLAEGEKRFLLSEKKGSEK